MYWTRRMQLLHSYSQSCRKISLRRNLRIYVLRAKRHFCPWKMYVRLLSSVYIEHAITRLG